MSNEIITVITPYIVDIGKIALFITIAGIIFALAKNAFTKGELRF